MKKVLEVNHLKKYYHTKKEEILSLKDVSFSVYEGEILSIVGPSGCGKSTILSILCNLISSSEGSVWKDNHYKVAYMLQEDSLLPYLTVLDNCCIGLKIENNLTIPNKKYVLNLLELYGLSDFQNKYPNQLSGGMRQRVALIRTLAVKPDILLLDEAMSALDYQSKLKIEEDIYNIIKKEGKTAILVTHDIEEAISMSDRILVLSNRPSSVKKIYNIELKENRSPIQNRSDPYFSKYFDLIWRDFNENL